MSISPIDQALTFLEDALEREYRFGLECLAIRRAAVADGRPWDAFGNMRQEMGLFRKHLNVPRLPKAKLRPGFGLKGSLLTPEQMDQQESVFGKRRCLKASLYASSGYEHVIRVLVSRRDKRTARSVDLRYDVVIDEGTLKLGNTNQSPCSDCGGDPEGTCSTCTCGGFYSDEDNDMGLSGPPLEIRRFDERPGVHEALFDAEL